jgi:hypothetical protein
MPDGSLNMSSILRQFVDRYNDSLEMGLVAYELGTDRTDRWYQEGADPSKLPRELQNRIVNYLLGIGVQPQLFATATQFIRGREPEVRPQTKDQQDRVNAILRDLGVIR